MLDRVEPEQKKPVEPVRHNRKILVVALIGLVILGAVVLSNRVAENVGSGIDSVETSAVEPNIGVMEPLMMDDMGAQEGSGGFMESIVNVSRKSLGAPTPSAPVEEVVTDDNDQRVIKNGHLSMTVKEVEPAVTDIEAIVKQLNGDVSSLNISKPTPDETRAFITVKVPVERFDEARGRLKEVSSRVLDESTSAQDVTEQYVDLEAQLKNKKEEEAAFQRILNDAEKTADVEDILAVTKQLSRVRGEIERLEGRLRYLEGQTAMARITITLTEDTKVNVPADQWQPIEVVKESFNDLVKNIQGLIDITIRFAIQLLPTLLIYGLGVLLLYWVGKKLFSRFFGDA